MFKSNSYVVTEQQMQIDLEMVPYDIWGTRAHVTMLHKIGVLNDGELDAILKALESIQSKFQQGTYQIDPNLGAQLTLEKEITEIAGKEIGGKIHTGRSRNDQITTAQKLFLRDKLLEAQSSLLQFIETLVGLSTQHIHTIMPGYTHMQPAKPTTLGQWCLAYVDMFLRDLDRLEQTYERHNTSPLGAAESYGTSWPLDREYTASLMGFDAVQEIPQDAIASRGEMETEVLSDLSFIHMHLSKIAQDLLLFSTYEFGFIQLGQDTAQRMGKVTGSSIMPQKKNPDVLELVRANTSVIYSMLFQTLEALKSLPFGYNRDSRESKETVTTALEKYNQSIDQMQTLLVDMSVNYEKMYQAVLDNYSLATDLADYLAAQYQIPYRIAYTIVGKLVDQAISGNQKLMEIDPAALKDVAQAEAGVSINLSTEQMKAILEPVACIERRKHVGGAAKEQMLKLIEKRKAQVQKHLDTYDVMKENVDQARSSGATVPLQLWASAV